MIRLPAPKADVLARRDAIVAGLRDLLPETGLISEAIRLKPYETDGLSAYRQMPLAVALPETTEQVADVLRFCHQNGVRVVPRGAGSGLYALLHGTPERVGKRLHQHAVERFVGGTGGCACKGNNRCQQG